MNSKFKGKVEKIESYYECLVKQIKNPDTRNNVEVDGIVYLIKYMADSLVVEEGGVFEDMFLKYLRVMTALTRCSAATSVDHFITLTEIMCKLCDTIEPNKAYFIDKFLSHWLQYLDNVSDETKSMTFVQSNHYLLKKCAHLMVNAKCASSQLRMSDILCSYITNVSDPPSTLLTLFSGIVKRQTLFAIETVQWNENGIAFDERQNLIRNINQMEQNHSFSELMTSIAFDNHPPITFPQNNGWLHINKALKIIEFWVIHDSKPVLVTIPNKIVKTVQIVDSGVCFVQRFRFTLESLPQQETYFGGKSEISDFKAQTIAVTLSAGIHRSKLMLLFRDKCEFKPEIIKNSKVCSDSDDDDLEMEIIELPNDQVSSFSELQSTTKKDDILDLMMIKTPPRPAHDTKHKASHQAPIIDDEIIPSKKSNREIPSAAFYGKRNTQQKPAPKSRQRRTTAESAQKNYRKAFRNTIFDFEKGDENIFMSSMKSETTDDIRLMYPKLPPLPETQNDHALKAKRKVCSEKQQMATNIEIGAKQFQFDEIFGRENSFPISGAHKPDQQKILQNLNKINAAAKKRSHEKSRVSFSYRSFSDPEMKKSKNMVENVIYDVNMIDVIDMDVTMKEDRFQSVSG